MKNVNLLLFSFIMLIGCNTDDMGDEKSTNEANTEKEGKKITICHKDSKTISISLNALQAHLDHGDTFGPCGSHYTFVPDDNFELALNQYDDIPNDNLVPTTNIEGVTNLDLIGKGISDLTGIEDFISLEYLNAQDNKLTGIDLSNNSFLKSINIGDNLVVDLDVSDKPDLINIIAYRNLLENINISNTPKLRLLSCSYNNLVNLDLSQNTELTRIYVTSNKLEKLIITNGNYLNVAGFSAFRNPLLTCIEVDDAAYSTTNWIRIDTSASFSEDCGY